MKNRTPALGAALLLVSPPACWDCRPRVRLLILAGHDGQPAGFAAMEITIPAGFPGPVPPAHDEFDEATTPKIVSNRLKTEVIPGPAFKSDS